MKKIFIDSSVFYTAVNSPTGGSAKLFTVDTIKRIVSTVILTEVERNVRKKLLEYHRERFFDLVTRTDIIDVSLDQRLIKKATTVIVKKDAVILSQAKQLRADFLITLDKKHFLTDTVRLFLKPTIIVTPRDFLNLHYEKKTTHTPRV